MIPKTGLLPAAPRGLQFGRDFDDRGFRLGRSANYASLADLVSVEMDDIAVEFIQDTKIYMASQILPGFPIQATDREGSFKVWDTPDQDEDTRRATGATPNRIETVSNSVSYSIVDYALEALIDADVALAIPDDRRIKIRTVLDQMLIAYENDVKTKVDTAAGYNATHRVAVTNSWSDQVDGDPIGDINNARQIIHKAIRRLPNTLIIGPNVFDDLTEHPALLARAGGGNPNMTTLSEENLATLFKVDRVWVPQAVNNSAAAGQTRVGANIWDSVGILAFIPDSPARGLPALGWTLMSHPMSTYTGVEHPEFLDFVGARQSRDEIFAAVDSSDLAIAGVRFSNLV